MTVSCYFGLTESGKSYHVQKRVIPNWERVVIFDRAKCFEGEIIDSPSKQTFVSLFNSFKNKNSYRLAIRVGRSQNELEIFNSTVTLALYLGRALGGPNALRVEPEKRLQMVVDEADFVCSSNFQSRQLKTLVNMGRHDNVDSHFIARMPSRIHNDIRVNASKIVTFKLQNSSDIPLFTDNFGRDLAKKIKDLPKYWHLSWQDNGVVSVFDDKNKIKKDFLNDRAKRI